MNVDIIKIVRESISIKGIDKPEKNKLHSKGYEGMVEFGYGAASGKYGMDVIKFNIINGYRINKYFFAGGGLTSPCAYAEVANTAIIKVIIAVYLIFISLLIS
jgi:hypothetical protein